MPQPRKYPNNAARQRAYRERKRLGLVSPQEARNQSRWLALVSETYGPGVWRTAYEIAKNLARGHHPTDDQLADAVGKSRRSVVAHRSTLRRDGFLSWAPGIGRGNANAYTLTTPESVKVATQRFAETQVGPGRKV